MKAKSIILISMFIILIVSAVSAQQINLSGHWLLNSSKSTFENVPLYVIFNKMTIAQKKDSIFIKSENENGTTAYGSTLTYPLNGNTTERIVHDNLKDVGSFKWSNDAKSLIRNQSYSPINNPKDTTQKIDEIWYLSDKGDELVIERTFTSFNRSQVSYTIRAVFDKQSK